MGMDANWWQQEIRRKSKSTLDILVYVAIILLILIIAFAGYLYAYLPEGGKILGFEIKEPVARIIIYTVGIISVIGITVSEIWKRRHKSFTRYLYVALDIIDNLKDIAEDEKTEMQDIANSYLDCCTDPNNEKECKEALKECCKELAKFAKPNL